MEATVLQLPASVAPPLWELERKAVAAAVPSWQRPERQAVAAAVPPREELERQGEVVPPWRGAVAELPNPFAYWKILLARAHRSVLDPTLSSSVLKVQPLAG